MKASSMPRAAFWRSRGSAAASKLGSALCGVVTFGFLARALGAPGLGEYRTVLTLLLFAGAIFDFGLYPITLREISQPEADQSRILGSAVGLRLVSMCLAIASLAVVVSLAGFDAAVCNGVLIAGGGWVCIQLHEMLKAVFQLKMAQQSSALAEMAGVTLALSLVIGLTGFKVGATGMLAATAIGFCLTGGLAWYYARQLVPFRPRFDLSIWRHFILTCVPFAVSAVLLIIRLRVDLLLLSVLRPPAEVCAVLFECAEPIVTLLAGGNFTPAARPLRVIAAAAGLAGLTSILRFGAIALNQQARMTRADLAGVGLAVVVNLILIPRFGLMGAAFGRLTGH